MDNWTLLFGLFLIGSFFGGLFEWVINDYSYPLSEYPLANGWGVAFVFLLLTRMFLPKMPALQLALLATIALTTGECLGALARQKLLCDKERCGWNYQVYGWNACNNYISLPTSIVWFVFTALFFYGYDYLAKK